MTTERPLALITGASAGIGEAFARALASRNHDLILVARRIDRLRELCATLESKHAITATAAQIDLSEPGAVKHLVSQLPQQAVDLLINNAGYGVPGAFSSSTWETHHKFQQVMINSVAELCWHIAPMMQSRGRGQIINIASLAGLIPAVAGHTLYAASKSWMIQFTRSLAAELHPSGVKCIAICPGFTYSEFHDVTGTRDSVEKLPKWMWLSSEAVVEESLRVIESSSKVVHVTGRVNRVLDSLANSLPRSWAYALAKRHGNSARDSS